MPSEVAFYVAFRSEESAVNLHSAKASVRVTLLCGMIFCAHSTFGQEKQAAGAPWSYDGSHGPDHWGDLESDFAECKVGTHQSPIDIRDAKEAELAPIRFDYKLSPLKIVNNG